ncbi:hypothetical protein GA0070564_10574 [Micromonospora mirobrigensis]|uniref:Lasso RiPP family leader peptide-containing protein n=2 Tax=Micromonospora mirobrigensis TaxID=262898 RepID=A0A1C4Z4Y1_9ACTN|nr:hypothetical protein GA0070564_10574 [Micromonospora mirobrigensis]
MPQGATQESDTDRVYQPPRIQRLGTLAELTQGGGLGADDGFGGAGASA